MVRFLRQNTMVKAKAARQAVSQPQKGECPYCRSKFIVSMGNESLCRKCSRHFGDGLQYCPVLTPIDIL